MNERWIVSCLSAFFIGLLVSAAHAHNPALYPNFAQGGWKYTILNRVFYTAPNQWNPNFTPRVDDAINHWNNLTGDDLNFFRALNSAASDQWQCGTSWDHMEITSGWDGPGGKISTTIHCGAPNSTVKIRYDGDDSWYVGSSTPNPDDKWDVQGVTTHELGHAHQAWGECTGDPYNTGGAEPCPGGHYDEVIEPQVCQLLSFDTNATLCSPSPPTPQSWRARTLETHDKDLVKSLY